MRKSKRVKRSIFFLFNLDRLKKETKRKKEREGRQRDIAKETETGKRESHTVTVKKNRKIKRQI